MLRMLIRRLVAAGVVTLSGLAAIPMPTRELVPKQSANPVVSDTGPLVGTWKLARIEGGSAKERTSGSNLVGLMMYDRAGYVAVGIMQGGRQKFVGSDPTPAEAKSAF